MSHAENKLPDFKSLVKGSHETCEAYYACLTTNEFGSTYLDPVKCKAKNFDPRKATKEQEERILLIVERFNKIKEEKGFRVAQEELGAALVYSNTLPKPILKPDPEVTRSDNPSIDKAIQLIGHKIKFYDTDFKVIAVKITKDGIFLDVEENVEGELIQHEIGYENDVVPL
ncbi:hypothetical protein RhiirA5_506451 [Rhizophagus irregularis]|uniref:Uncharacterized protein n=1 Tax=Rhizophagus irregularis TaxID=588596 RepID=A0A2I1FFT3_9GLOM|nr:hypothetical protein RhiirA5_506451 [Rhizophagus irregularis]PKC63745.1 hypothetical protein RhiirA1_518656 [Rhizophagus irregularis]PKY33245.1 hypothetical protein RhiirB3_532398 [Rhizophagus irregularis]CAB4483403.1 unnamed protein product [Rhizophagus irregularis]CAB5185551.1 unnamed protein product [Rhizophagus irregularis]